MSYACDPGLGECHLLHAAPDHSKGQYTTYGECQQNCGTHVGGQYSFVCSPGLGCHRVNAAPNHAEGRYSNYHACAENCTGGAGHSFDCVSLGSAGGQHHVCVMKHGAGGQYPTRAACLRAGCQGQN